METEKILSLNRKETAELERLYKAVPFFGNDSTQIFIDIARKIRYTVVAKLPTSVSENLVAIEEEFSVPEEDFILEIEKSREAKELITSAKNNVLSLSEYILELSKKHSINMTDIWSYLQNKYQIHTDIKDDPLV